MAPDDQAYGEGFAAVLFPHSHLPAHILRKILSLFWPLTLFQPWFMERPNPLPAVDKTNAVQILYPPEEMRPGGDFAARLKAYRQWMENHLDRGLTGSLNAIQEGELTENSTWEIRRMIRKDRVQREVPGEDPILKWHLILHLAQESEDHRLEAEALLAAMKGGDVPLKGAVDDSEHLQGLFQDLPSFEMDPGPNENRIVQVLEAWFGLFGGYLRGEEFLVTWDRHIMDYVRSQQEAMGAEAGASRVPLVGFAFPDLSRHPLEEITEMKRDLFEDQKVLPLQGLLKDLAKGQVKDLPMWREQLKEMEASWDRKSFAQVLAITVQYLASLPQSAYTGHPEVLRRLSGSTLVWVKG